MARTFVGRRTLHAAWGWLFAAALACFMHASAWAALAIDAVVVTNRSSSATNVTSPALSTPPAASCCWNITCILT